MDDAVVQAEQAAAALEDLGAGPLGLMITSDSQTGGQESIMGGGGAMAAGGRSAVENGGAMPAVGDYVQSGQGVMSNLRNKLNLGGPAIMRKGLGVKCEKGMNGMKGGGLPGKFVIQVDGVGSYLVLRNSFVTVGPVSSSQKPDIGVIAEPNLPVVGIERTDGDYFLRSNEAIQMKDQTVKEKLLANGDRIGLSPRCRMRFEISNAASSTAVLTLSSGRFPRADIRQVILLDREIIVGPGTTAHIRVDQADETTALYLQDGRLYCRSREVVKANHRTLERESAMPMDTPIQIGEISFVITKSE